MRGADFSQHLVVGAVGDVHQANVVVLAIEAAGLNGVGGTCSFRRGEAFGESGGLAANGERFTHYVGQFALYPCTARGRRRATPSRVPSFVAAIGARAGGVVAWSDTNAVIAETGGA